MESQNKEREYERSIWGIYRKEFATASPERQIALNNWMLRWQELMKDGLTASQAYYRAMQEESDKPPIHTAMEEDSKREVTEVVSSETTNLSRWSWNFKVASVILAIAIIVAVIYGGGVTKQRNALNTELKTTQAELSSTNRKLSTTQSELSSTKQTLASAQSELSSAKKSLVSAQTDLASTKQTLASAQSELSSTKQSLVSAQTNLASTKQTLASAQSELGTTKTKLATVEEKVKLIEDTLGVQIFSGAQPKIAKPGVSLTRDYVNLTNNPNATNPTWSELMTFLRTDATDDYYYNSFSFNCTNSAEMLHNNAETRGIKAAFVAVSFKGEEIGHALNAFKTTDKGLVYVDCTGQQVSWYGRSYAIELDRIAYLKKDREYGVASINMASSPEYSFYEGIGRSSGSGWESLGIVESIKIYW